MNRESNFDLSKTISSLWKLSEKFGKLSLGRHKRLKFELSAFKLSLFSDFNSKLISELIEIFLNISNKIAAEVVLVPSFSIFTSFYSS